MGIPRGGLDLRVTEELADHRQALSEGQGAGRKAVPQVFSLYFCTKRQGLGLSLRRPQASARLNIFLRTSRMRFAW